MFKTFTKHKKYYLNRDIVNYVSEVKTKMQLCIYLINLVHTFKIMKSDYYIMLILPRMGFASL
jgi:hypothetical protein